MGGIGQGDVFRCVNVWGNYFSGHIKKATTTSLLSVYMVKCIKENVVVREILGNSPGAKTISS